MKNQPLVSVGLPVYNRPDGLRNTLECITNQTYVNLEIIISNNCSPDERVEKIAKEYQEKDSRIRYFKQKKNTGYHYNSMFVLKKASGYYYMWASDDDYWENDYIEKNIQILNSSNDVVLSISRVELIGVDHVNSYATGTLKIADETFPERARTLLTYPSPSYNSRIWGLMKREAIINSIMEDDLYAGDWGIMLNLLEYGKFEEVDKVLMKRSCDGVSKTFKSTIDYFNFKGIKKYFCLYDLTRFIIRRHGWTFFFKIFKQLFFWNKYFFKIACNEFNNMNFKIP